MDKLIPTDCVKVTEVLYPLGWYVARYDAEGLTHNSRWFRKREDAEAYAEVLMART